MKSPLLRRRRPKVDAWSKHPVTMFRTVVDVGQAGLGPPRTTNVRQLARALRTVEEKIRARLHELQSTDVRKPDGLRS